MRRSRGARRRRLVASLPGLALVAAVLCALSACSPAGRFATPRGFSAPTTLGNLSLMPKVIPFVRCPGGGRTVLRDWGLTSAWNRVGPAYHQGVRHRRTMLVVFRRDPQGPFGQAVVCSRRRTGDSLQLTVKVQLRALRPSTIDVSIRSVAAWNVNERRQTRRILIGRTWKTVSLSGRLDASKHWYALYVVSSGDAPFLVRRPILRLAK